MRRTTRAPSCVASSVACASAAVLCLSALLTGCGSTSEKGYVAMGAADPADGHAPLKPVPPEGRVELSPLDGDRHGDGATKPSGATEPAPGPSAPPTAPGTSPGGPTNSPSAPPSSHPPDDSTPDGSPSPKPPSPTIPADPDAPAGLLTGKPRLADTDVRWCQKVTLDFLNTGKRPVAADAGTVTFGTHIIGPLGIDWATIDSTHRLPLPLAPGQRKTGTWRVCVDAWRVPLGMHLDTRDVTFTWK